MPKFSPDKIPAAQEARDKRRGPTPDTAAVLPQALDRNKLKQETAQDEAHRLNAAFRALQKMSDGESPREVLEYLASQNKVTPERLNTIKNYLEMVEMKKADEKKTEVHSANFALITAIEDALSEPNPERMSMLLNSALGEGRIARSKRSGELFARQTKLENKIKELTGKSPEELAAQKTTTGVFGSVVGWLRKISGQAADDAQVQKLMTEWRNLGLKVKEAEETPQFVQGKKAAEEAWTPPAKAKAMPQIVETLTAEDIIEQEVKLTPQEKLGRVETDIGIAKLALGKAKGEEMREWAKEVKKLERQREALVSEMRGKGLEVAPTLKEAEDTKNAARLRREAEEAFEVRKKMDAEAKDKATEQEFLSRVKWATELLPGGQAFSLSQDVMGQLGVANWEKATTEQRKAASDYVFKAAEYQQALKSADKKLESKLEHEIKALEKSLGLVRSPYFAPSGRAGVGVTLESGRQGAAGTAARLAGAETRNRPAQRARRTVNETPVIQAVPLEVDLEKGATAAREVTAGPERHIAAVKKAAAEAIAKTKVREEAIEAGMAAAKAVVAGPERHIAAIKKAAAEAVSQAMTVEKAGEIVPDAAKLWDLVAGKLKQKPEAEKKLAALKKYGVGEPATVYVLAMARYLEAVNQPATLGVIRGLEDSMNKANAALGIAGNALVQRIMTESGKKFGKPVGRNIKGAARHEDTRRGGRSM